MKDSSTTCPCPACDDRRSESATCTHCEGEGLSRRHVANITATGICLHCHGTGREGGQYGQDRTPAATAWLRTIDNYHDPRHHKFAVTRPCDGNTGYAADAVTCRHCGFGPSAHTYAGEGEVAA